MKMTMEKKTAVAAIVMSEELRKFFKVNSCVAGTRCMIDLLAMADVKAIALQVEMMATNGAWESEFAAGRPPLQHPEAWSVGLGMKDTNEDGLALHMVAWLPEHSILVDVTADQASRPKRGIELGPIVITVPDHVRDLFLGGEWLQFSRVDHPMRLRYRVVSRQDYKGSPDWELGSKNQPFRDRVLAAVGKRLGDLVEVEL